MTFVVRLTKQAEKFFRELPKADQQRIREQLAFLAYPDKVPAIKIKGRKNVYRLRIGAYRILYLVDRQHLISLVLKIDKRSRVYKR